MAEVVAESATTPAVSAVQQAGPGGIELCDDSGEMPQVQCCYCFSKSATIMCAQCEIPAYCGELCRHMDWTNHKPLCIGGGRWCKQLAAQWRQKTLLTRWDLARLRAQGVWEMACRGYIAIAFTQGVAEFVLGQETGRKMFGHIQEPLIAPTKTLHSVWPEFSRLCAGIIGGSQRALAHDSGFKIHGATWSGRSKEGEVARSQVFNLEASYTERLRLTVCLVSED